MNDVRAEMIAAYILFKYALAFERSFPRFTDLWVSANLHSTKMEAQYNIAQNRWIAYLKASK